MQELKYDISKSYYNKTKTTDGIRHEVDETNYPYAQVSIQDEHMVVQAIYMDLEDNDEIEEAVISSLESLVDKLKEKRMNMGRTR